jgi:SAM-dependent methyltransferase
VWGLADVDSRQKWTIVWPWLERAPATGISLHDSGCGKGAWSLELGCRRPGWSITGVDVEAEYIEEAEGHRRSLSLSNVDFERSDLSEFHAKERYDIVLSVFSSHYLTVAGRGQELFRRFEEWLKPGGRLVLLAPRRIAEAPFSRLLPRRRWWSVYSHEELTNLCASSGLRIEQLTGRVGRIGAFWKQAAGMFSESRWSPVRWVLSPLSSAMCWFDVRRDVDPRSPSLYWLLIARKGAPRAEDRLPA